MVKSVHSFLNLFNNGSSNKTPACAPKKIQIKILRNQQNVYSAKMCSCLITFLNQSILNKKSLKF